MSNLHNVCFDVGAFRLAVTLQVDTDMCRAVRASMGVPEKDRGKNLMKADDSAQRVIKIVDDLDMSKSGTFWAADTGEILAW